RLYVLDAWEEAPFYSERERAAFALTDAVTRITEGHVPDAVFERARAHFNEQELTALVFTLTTINAWNRLAITMRTEVGKYQPKATPSLPNRLNQLRLQPSLSARCLSKEGEWRIFMSKVWLITGSGNGLGRDIAEAALAAGDSVVAGARRTEELAPLVAQYGQRVKPVKLEVRDEAAAKAAVRLAVETFGRLDVLVNNAGYGQFAPFEQMSAGDFQAIVDTCFYGVVYTTRAAVPVMRKQKSGHIFQVSSVGGRHAVPGNT